MDIPLELLLDYMGYLNPEIRILQRDMWVKGVKMLTDEGGLDPAYVYFAELADGGQEHDEAVVVWTCSPGTETPGNLGNCIILHTEVSLSRIFNEMLSYQTLIRDWERDMEFSVSRREGVQRLVDISARVFNNPLAVLDFSLKTMASTKGIEVNDPLFREIIEPGYFSRSTYNKLRDGGYLNLDLRNNETIIIDTKDLFTSPCAMTFIVRDGVTVFTILMLSGVSPLSRGLMQLYELFIEKVSYYLRPAAESHDYIRNQQEYFIIDVIEGKITAAREIDERSLAFPTEFKTEYISVLISHESDGMIYLEHAMNRLSELFPQARRLLMRGDVLLYPALDGSEAQHDHFMDSLAGFLEDVHAFAGISDVHTGLHSLRESYKQSADALRFGWLLSGKSTVNDMLRKKKAPSRIFRFSDYHIYSLLSGGENSLGLLEDIVKFDLEHNTEYYRMLYVLLSTERSFTKAGEILHMHRNNVIYHAKRISELFGIDFENPSQRLRLLMLYSLGDLLE